MVSFRFTHQIDKGIISMKVSLNWLKEYVAIESAEKDLANALTMAGLEVEAITDRFSSLSPIKVGRITAVTPHPKADRLSICLVDIGDNHLTIVCGAPNAASGRIVPVALPGTVLPGGFALKTVVIRGQQSEGMLCGESELGLGPDSGGLMILPDDTPIGESLTKVLGLSDPIFEIGLTPNRPDCLSIVGIAREVAAIEKSRVQYPDTNLTDTGAHIFDIASVTIEAPDHCPRYAARLIENIRVGPSPFWLQDRLLSIGLRPINNIVDITNFVMMEMGQPLHAFDFDQLSENRIVVRTAAEGELFTTLDKKERRLSSDMLMICDGKKPVAIAGVMGGLNSEIENATNRVLLESACFDPISIRKTAKRLGLGTDASYRFERGVDPHITVKALNRAAKLMVDIAGGSIVDGHIDAHPRPAAEKTIPLSVSATNRLLGTDIKKVKMCHLLSTIEIGIETAEGNASGDVIRVTPPSYRVDITRPEDLMEEIARLSGYGNIPTTLPAMPAQTLQLPGRTHIRSAIRNRMSGMGFSEAINYSFIHHASCDRLNLKQDDPRRATVAILNPLSEDQTVMRSSLIPGLLETMRRNVSKQIKDLKLFEIGQSFYADTCDELPRETEILAGLWTGARYASAWHQPLIACDFYDLKGAVEELLSGFNITGVIFTQQPYDECTYLRPGFSAQIFSGKNKIGVVGEIHPVTLKQYDLKQTAFVFELDLEKMSRQMPDKKAFLSLSKFPATSRDVTLIIDKNIEAHRVLNMVNIGDEQLVEKVHLFDVFEGNPIARGKKSISFRITYRSITETLEDELINEIHYKISQRLISEFKADLPA
jgi:phenylalanyl-tRNA synthetase beta chain